ncbi:MAG: protein-L-isoaspartate(D-aspartate) O-methyltransferase [Phycisphaerae bacterium]|nr:protein-L-isoaspartate(D-aspartate) O-methyltransferase [Phycisphaerae bacterium]
MERAAMVQMQLKARGIADERVLAVMGELPREAFVPAAYAPEAYADRPLPIGMGQTISQPYIVALMTAVLEVTPDCDVLELGTGCGYQTAILAKLARRVYTIDRLPQLTEAAQAVLGRLGIDNVDYFVGDGSKGWPEDRRFDRIIVTAAMPEIPQTLLEQMNDEAILSAPVGDEAAQDLMVHEKSGDEHRSRIICPCRFVKLIGKHAFPE